MNGRRSRRVTPALVVAMIALFVALGGTAGAVAMQAVPLAKRALTADNSKKLGGQTSAQLVAQAAQRASQLPGPASSAAGVVTVKTQALGAIAADQGRMVTISCDAGGKVLGGGFSSDGPVFNFDSFPSGDGTWSLYLVNPDETAPHNVTLYATCIK